jgi:hypothetical protein
MRIKAFMLLPEAADADVAWALDQCLTRQSLTQKDAYKGLVERLKARGINEHPRHSSFHRFVLHARTHGIPPRYKPDQAKEQTGLEALIVLLDERIEAALKRRGL